MGAEWVMWLLLGLGFIGVVIALERLTLFMQTRVDVTAMAVQLSQLISRGEIGKAKGLVEAGKAMEERVLADALDVYAQGPDTVEQVSLGSVIRERQRYERALSFLGTLGSNAPFIGLLGTVIGVIISFKQLGDNPKGGLEIVGPGISEALVATAVGLMVAIPSVVAFNAFKAALKQRVNNSDVLVHLVIAQLRRIDLPGSFAAGAPAEEE